MANGDIGIKGWRNYSRFSLFGSGSQRSDRNSSILVDTYSGNLSVVATDWNLAGRIPCSLTRSYNHQDSTSGVDRPFGPGWTWQYDMCLTGSMNGSGNVTWKAGDGSEYLFTYSSGPVWSAPAGMFDYTLTYDGGASPARYFITVGTMLYTFEVNTTNSLARLIRIEDAFGNALNIVRVYSSSMPTFEIDKLQIEYVGGGGGTHDIVDFTYTGSLITQLRLLDTLDGGDYLDIHYTYNHIDSDDRLTQVEPKFGSTALDMEVQYDYNATSTMGLQMTDIFDTAGAKGSYSWQPSYSSNKVSSIAFPIDSTPTTGTVSYTYAGISPSGWSHGSPSAWNKVTDANGKNWFYGQNSDGTVQFVVDPLWINGTHESYTEYTYETYFPVPTNQIESVSVPKPNGESGRLISYYYYNSDRRLAAVVDNYGFCSFYAYGTRTDYNASGTGATKKDVIGVFTPKPEVQAYATGDHTTSETVAPSLSTPVTVSGIVTVGSAIGVDYWYYADGSGSPKQIKLARSVNDYTFASGTGQLTQLLSCSPANFGESTFSSYTLTSASACSKQEYDSTTGDLYKSYTPRQFQNSALKYSQFTYDQTYGSLTRSANADGVNNNPTTPDATEYTYDATSTYVTKVAQPEDPSNQWVEYGYTAQYYRSTVTRPDIQSWGIDPVVSVTDYDYNGNVSATWQAKPAGTPADWDGNTGGGGYDQLTASTYDRINRLVSQDTYVDDRVATPDTLTSTFQYDDNGNLVRRRGPGYLVGMTTYYSYSFTHYDDANRVDLAYNMIADSSSNLSPNPGTQAYVKYSYDVAGNVVKVYDQLYDWPNDPSDYHYTAYTFDYLMRQVETTGNYDDSGPTARTTVQNFDASGAVRYTQNGEGYQLWPEYDLNGRQIKLHRDSSGGDADLREYDADGNLLNYYTYKDINTDSGNYRFQYSYDRLDRRINDQRAQQLFPGVWVGFAPNTADTEFDLNGNLRKSYDKVNSGKFTERTYDDWQQLHLLKSPQVPDPSGIGTVIYETENFYDVLGRRIQVDDNMNNSTLFELDQLGRVTLVTDALMYTTTTVYDERGNRYQTILNTTATYTYTYDDENRLSQLDVDHDSQPSPDTTTYSYNELGMQTEVDYPDGGVTKIFYDELNRRNETQVLLSGSDYLSTTYTYNLNNQVLVTTLPGAYTITNVYSTDSQSLLLTVTDTNGDVTTYTYDDNNRRETETRPSGLVTTWSYDWLTQQVSSVLQEIDTTSGHDITTSYTYNANGQPTTITDGDSHAWVKSYDAMLRLTALMMPNTNSHAITMDGNSNIIKTVDFRGTSHYYFYDALNRMTEHGPNSTGGTNTEKYLWNCCTQLQRYEDAFSSGSTNMLTYDQLNRLTSMTDTQGNQVQYAYDSMGRVLTITPAQGSNYRTEYTYNANGSLNDITIYVAGTGETTSYTYDTTSGKLLQRDMPVVSSNHIRTAYSYDSAGRLEYETVTREAGGTTNLYKTQYAYAYIAAGSGGGRTLTRTEQNYSGGWVNDYKVEYTWNALEWMRKEQRWDWALGSWVAKYDVNQEYDKRGNRTRYDKNVQGSGADYGIAYDLGYTFDGSSLLTAITDADNGAYSASVTCDANSNITSIDEVMTGTGHTPQNNHVYTYFDVDDLNRVTAYRTKTYFLGNWIWEKRAHQYDGLGRATKSTYKNWIDGTTEPAGTSIEHVYSKDGEHLQNYDGVSTYGSVWHWAGADPMPETRHALKSPNADTASQTGYNLATNASPQERTFLNPTTEGDRRHEWGQGRPMAKDSSGSGSNWATGLKSNVQNINQVVVESRLDYSGTVSATVDRGTDAREKGRIGIFGSMLSYAGSYGRVTSEAIGRDVNPLGRGDGNAYVAGWINQMRIYPALPKSVARGGQGNSVNNDCQGCQAKTLTGQGGRPYGQFAPGITPIDNDPNWNNHFCQFCCRTYWKGPIKKWQGEMPLGCFECVCGLNHQPGVSGPGIRPGGGNGGSLPPVEGQGPPAGSSPSPGVPGGGVGVSRPGNPSVPGYPPRNNCCDNIPATMECKDDPNSSRACSILAYFQLPTPQELCKDWLSGVSYFCNQALEMCIVLALAGILGLGDELQNQIAGVLISILGGTADDPHHVLSPDNWIAIILSGLLAILSRLEVPGIGEVTMTLILAAIACCFLAWIKCKEIAQRGYCTNRAKIPPKIDWAGNYCLNASPGSGGPGILLPPGLGGPIHGVAL